jgi:hypothetical protein
MGKVFLANKDSPVKTPHLPVPVGGSPTGADESPAPPNFQTGSNPDIS